MKTLYILAVLVMSCGGGGSSESPPPTTYNAAEMEAAAYAVACLGLPLPTSPHILYSTFELTSTGCVVRDPNCPFPPVGSSQYCLQDNTIAIGMPLPGTICNDFIQHYFKGWPEQALRTEFLNAVAYQNGIYQDQYGSPCDRGAG